VLEGLHFILGDCVGEGTQDSNHIVTLNQNDPARGRRSCGDQYYYYWTKTLRTQHQWFYSNGIDCRNGNN